MHSKQRFKVIATLSEKHFHYLGKIYDSYFQTCSKLCHSDITQEKWVMLLITDNNFFKWSVWNLIDREYISKNTF